MTRAVRAPGRDRPPESPTDSGLFRPGSGAGGVYAQFLQGATPKYAINDGYRSDLFRNTMSRMFVRVDAEEMELFRNSITDTHTRRNLAPRLAGDPRPSPRPGRAAVNAQDPTARRVANVHSNGYLDYLLSGVQISLREKVSVMETLADNYVLLAFGQSAPTWQFSGSLLNTVQDDQASNMFRLYTEILRATQMARRQKVLSISFDSYVVTGVMSGLDMQLGAQNELVIPFSFPFIVKRVHITNYTAGWTPTRATSAFAADLNAIPYDGRPREQQALSRIAARTPAGTDAVTPTPQNQADPRTRNNAGLSTGTTTPVFTNTPSVQEELAAARRPYVLLPSAEPDPLSNFNTVVNPQRPETVVSENFTRAR